MNIFPIYELTHGFSINENKLLKTLETLSAVIVEIHCTLTLPQIFV